MVAVTWPIPRIWLLLVAKDLDVTPDMFLSCVAILHAEDFTRAAREAPADVTLDALYRVAWWHGIKIDLRIGPQTIPGDPQ